MDSLVDSSGFDAIRYANSARYNLLWNCTSIQIRISPWITPTILKECFVHASSPVYSCLCSYAHAQNSGSRHSSERGSTAALSASAASTYPYAAIDRPGTYSPYERSGLDSPTTVAGHVSASGTP